MKMAKFLPVNADDNRDPKIAFAVFAIWVLVCSPVTTASSSSYQHREGRYMKHKHHTLTGHSLMNISGITMIRCMALCLENDRCLSLNYSPANGVCQISHAKKDSFPGSLRQDASFDYFDCREKTVMGIKQAPEWQLAFKAVAGTGVTFYNMWTTTDWNPSLEVGGNWRDNSLHEAWRNGHLDIRQVMLSVGDSTGVKAELVFNGVGSDIKSWFTQERLMSSPWQDLKTSSWNYFSVDGDLNLDRRFFIHKKYGTCSIDEGWLVVSETNTDARCSWEDSTAKYPYPIIVYSKTNAAVTYLDLLNAGSATVGRAEYLAIHIKV